MTAPFLQPCRASVISMYSTCMMHIDDSQTRIYTDVDRSGTNMGTQKHISHLIDDSTRKDMRAHTELYVAGRSEDADDASLQYSLEILKQ